MELVVDGIRVPIVFLFLLLALVASGFGCYILLFRKSHTAFVVRRHVRFGTCNYAQVMGWRSED